MKPHDNNTEKTLSRTTMTVIVGAVLPPMDGNTIEFCFFYPLFYVAIWLTYGILRDRIVLLTGT